MNLRLFFSSIALICILFVSVLPHDAQAATGLPFGGFVSGIVICPDQSSLLVTVISVTPGQYMFTPKSVPLLYGPPRNIGQAVMGTFAPAPLPCTASGAPLGAGLPVTLYGTSKI